MDGNTGFEIREPDDSVPLPVVHAEEAKGHESISTERDFDIREPESPAPSGMVHAGEVEVWYR